MSCYHLLAVWVKKPISQIREIAETDKMVTNALGLVNAAEKLCSIAKGIKGDRSSFHRDFPLSAIAYVIKDNLLHYVVIHRIKKGSLLVADTGEGFVTYLIDASKIKRDVSLSPLHIIPNCLIDYRILITFTDSMGKYKFVF